MRLVVLACMLTGAIACNTRPFDTRFGLGVAQLKEIASRARISNLSAPLTPCRIDPPANCNEGKTVSGKHDYPRSACAPMLCHHIAYEVVDDFTAWANFANRHNITWWLTAGTLLGFYRNGGIMPWDDDIDVSIWDDDVLKLFNAVIGSQWALFVHKSKGRIKSPLSSGMLKQFRVNSHANPVLRGAGYPAIDIFPLTQASAGCKVLGLLPRQKTPSFYDDIMPLKGFQWNNATLWMPNNPEAILDSIYNEWRTTVVSMLDHVAEKMLPPATYELSYPPEVLR